MNHLPTAILTGQVRTLCDLFAYESRDVITAYTINQMLTQHHQAGEFDTSSRGGSNPTLDEVIHIAERLLKFEFTKQLPSLSVQPLSSPFKSNSWRISILDEQGKRLPVSDQITQAQLADRLGRHVSPLVLVATDDERNRLEFWIVDHTHQKATIVAEMLTSKGVPFRRETYYGALVVDARHLTQLDLVSEPTTVEYCVEIMYDRMEREFLSIE